MPDEILQPSEPVAEAAAPATAAAPAAEKAPRSRGKKRKKFVAHGHAHILATYNNTIVTLSDPAGNVLGWASSGMVGFKGPKKATPYAAGMVVRTVVEKVKDVGLKSVDVFLRGIGSGREAAVRALNANGIAVQMIKDITPTAHNGCRPRKVRRV
jgi:small subunit ribosomal protein S11